MPAIDPKLIEKLTDVVRFTSSYPESTVPFPHP